MNLEGTVDDSVWMWNLPVPHIQGNPLEEKHSAEGDWRDRATTYLDKLKKLDGNLNHIGFL